MLFENLSVDIGNTNILFCFFERRELLSIQKNFTNNLNLRKLNPLKSLYLIKDTKIIISSVVPECDFIFIKVFDR